MVSILKLTPGILAYGLFSTLTRKSVSKVSDVRKAPEAILLAAIIHMLGKTIGLSSDPDGVWDYWLAHLIGLCIGFLLATVTFAIWGEGKSKWIGNHIKSFSPIPEWYSHFCRGSGKWYQVERFNKEQNLFGELKEWPAHPDSGYYRMRLESVGGKPYEGSPEVLIPARTVELLEIREDPNTEQNNRSSWACRLKKRFVGLLKRSPSNSTKETRMTLTRTSQQVPTKEERGNKPQKVTVPSPGPGIEKRGGTIPSKPGAPRTDKPQTNE